MESLRISTGPSRKEIPPICLFLDIPRPGPLVRHSYIRLRVMTGSKSTIVVLTFAFGLTSVLGGCYLYDGANYDDWLEYRVKRDEQKVGELVAKVKRRGNKAKWPGDSYEILIRWPTNVEALPIPLGPAERKKEADAFVRKLCGVNGDIYVIDESFNDRTGEVYFKLWCRPPKRG